MFLVPVYVLTYGYIFRKIKVLLFFSADTYVFIFTFENLSNKINLLKTNILNVKMLGGKIQIKEISRHKVKHTLTTISIDLLLLNNRITIIE